MFMNSSEDESDDKFNVRLPNAPRVYQERKNYLETLDDGSFHRRFRLNKQAFVALLGAIEADIAPTTKR